MRLMLYKMKKTPSYKEINLLLCIALYRYAPLSKDNNISENYRIGTSLYIVCWILIVFVCLFFFLFLNILLRKCQEIARPFFNFCKFIVLLLNSFA